MTRSRRTLLRAGMAALTLAASAAHATSFIGLQQDAGPIVTVTSSPGSASFFGTFGQFEQVSVTAFGQPTTVLPTLLQGSGSVTNNGGAANAGMLTMYITSTGYTAPLGSLQFTSGFATVDLTQGWTETSRTFLDPGNGIFTLATQLGSATFTTVNSELDTVIANTGAGPYSVTTVYTFAASSFGTATSSSGVNVAIAAVPEPESYALMLVGLGLMCFVTRRRTHEPV